MKSGNIKRYYILKCLIRYLLSNKFFSQNSDLPMLLVDALSLFCTKGGGDEMSTNIVFFALYEAELDNQITSLPELLVPDPNG